MHMLYPTPFSESSCDSLSFFTGVYAMAVSEDKVPGEEVGRLKARDPDLAENGLVDYRILEGDGMNLFEITKDSETQEAVIKLKKVKCVRVPNKCVNATSSYVSVIVNGSKWSVREKVRGVLVRWHYFEFLCPLLRLLEESFAFS